MPVSETETEAAKRLTEALAELEQAGKAAHEYGLRISDKAIKAMNQLPTVEQRVELALWLTRDENFDVAHRLMGLSDDEQAREIPFLAAREDVKGSLKDGNTDDWINLRSEARGEGRRR